MNPPVIPAVVERHAEDGAFLWLLRDHAVGRPHYTLRLLAELDQRVEANIDALRVADQAGWETSRRAIEQGGAGEVFAAAVLAFESAVRPCRVCARGRHRVAAKSARTRIRLRLATWPSQAASHLQKLHSAHEPALRRVGLASSAIHRVNPGRALQEALDSGDSSLKARALRASANLVSSICILPPVPTSGPRISPADSGPHGPMHC